MRSNRVAQFDNKTPTKPKGGKYFIPASMARPSGVPARSGNRGRRAGAEVRCYDAMKQAGPPSLPLAEEDPIRRLANHLAAIIWPFDYFAVPSTSLA